MFPSRKKSRDDTQSDFPSKPIISAKLRIGQILGFLSLCCWIIIASIFYTGSDAMTLVTCVPFWLCCVFFSAPAIISWVVCGSRIGLLAVFIWSFYGIINTDFLPALSRSGMEYYQLPPLPEHRSIRVMTLYEKEGKMPNVDQIAELNVDVIFLQGLNNYNRALKFAYMVFGKSAVVKQIGSCAVIVRNGQLGSAFGIDKTDGIIIDWIPEKYDLAIRLVSLHLAPFAPEHSFFSPASWEYFRELRLTHREQIRGLFYALQEATTKRGDLPIIIGGDFQASPNSPIFTAFSNNFEDCFRLRGAGYGATYPVEDASLRLDRIFASPPLTPLRSKTVRINDAQRRSVVADIELPRANY